MAKKSKLEKNKKIALLIERYKGQREELKAIIANPETSFEEREEAMRKMDNIPRNASPIRYRNRCGLTGRPRGYLRRYNLCRIAFRELSHEGKIPGVTKSSW